MDDPICKTRQLVLLRHGESLWNKENLFTGWTDVDLSDHGREEGREAGRGLKERGFSSMSPLRPCLRARYGPSGSCSTRWS